MGSRAWDEVRGNEVRGNEARGNEARDYGTADVEITSDWASFAHWTPAQRALKIELDGERRQAEQIAESTGRLVSRLVAEMVASERVAAPEMAA